VNSADLTCEKMNEETNQQRLRLYLIRHGEVEGAREGRLLGRTDAPLSECGIVQANQLAEELSGARLAAVYSSDLQRARMMAEIIAGRINLKVQENRGWREVDMGDWEGCTIAQLHQNNPELVEHVFNDPASFQYPGGEAFSSFTTRVQAALDQLLRTHEKGDIALITHAGVCRAIVGGVLGVPMNNWLRLAQAYACVNVIEWYDASPVLVMLNHKIDYRGRETTAR
jgi:alpha-ribazole phosphatase